MRPIKVPQTGRPAMKARVPSIGSSTQMYSASVCSSPNSSPMMPCVGKVRRISCRMAASPARSASVTGSNAAPPDLSRIVNPERKNGRIAWPDWLASSLTNCAKSMSPMSLRFRPAASSAGPRRGLSAARPSGKGFRDGPRRGTPVTHKPSPLAGGLAVLVATLVAIYSISQFLRNSIAVIANDLAQELDLSATEVGLLSSAFFLAFAAAQIPVGIAIDRYGPKRTMLASAVVCIAGTGLFAAAETGAAIIAPRALMGLGCSTFFMAPLAIYARRFPPEDFAFLTSLQLGL